MASNVLSKDVNLVIQCPLKKKQKIPPKLSFCGRTLLSNYCCLWKVHHLVLLERLWLDNNFKLILEGMLWSRFQKLRIGQLARPLKIHKIHVFSFYNIKKKLYKDNVCVTTWILLLHVLSDDDRIFGTKELWVQFSLHSKGPNVIQWKVQLKINLLSINDS